jgi:aryl-alcohol dehydrogenase-like predicted oxidoreductase
VGGVRVIELSSWTATSLCRRTSRVTPLEPSDDRTYQRALLRMIGPGSVQELAGCVQTHHRMIDAGHPAEPVFREGSAVRYSRLGDTGLVISEMILGTATFGELVDAEGVDALVAAALDRGVTTFDTADIYGAGRAQQLLGHALRSRRDQVVLCTKVGLRTGESVDDLARLSSGGTLDHAERWRRGISPNDMGSSRVHIVSAVEASLRRLGTEYIDVYQVHRWDPVTPVDETLATLDDLVRVGKIRYAGCSGFAPAHLALSHGVSVSRQLTRFVSQQVPYNLLARDAESTIFPACQALHVGVLAFMPLAGGLLTGRYDRHAGPEAGSRFAVRPTYRDAFWTQSAFTLVDELSAVAAAAGRTLAEMALGWVAANLAVSAVLVGAEQVDELAQNVKVFERPRDGDELAAVNEVAQRRARR